MPIHYAAGQNVQTGTAFFDNVKTVVVTFENAFLKTPNISLTMNDSGAVPVFKTDVTTTQFVIRFKTSWSGEVDWKGMER